MLSSNTSQVSDDVKYIENFFQTWLRTGTGASATVTTGLDASLNKALVWTKSRSAATDHKLTDTVRGATKALISDTTGAQTTDTNGLTAFSSTGYTIGSDTNYNNSGATYVDFEFVATPKFFDVVTYTGDGVSGRAIPHNLGSTPGCIIVKATSTTSNWAVYHRGLTANQYTVYLNSTAAENYTNEFPSAPTSTDFYVRSSTNSNGVTFVAYVFAHNAGGFGLTGTDNVISCGSATLNGSGVASVNLGYEPQWLLVKSATSVENWYLLDNMRGMPVGSADAYLMANSSAAEGNYSFIDPTATGFNVSWSGFASQTIIYIAIRRGPMKVPTDATKVFQPVAISPSGAAYNDTTTFPVDMSTIIGRIIGFPSISYKWFTDRLRGTDLTLTSTQTAAEYSISGLVSGCYIKSDTMTGLNVNDTNGSWGGGSGQSLVSYNFRRAPNFFDEVCYTGNGTTQTLTHNLKAVPELMIVKSRNLADTAWSVYTAAQGAGKQLYLQSTAAVTSSAGQFDTAPTSSSFYVGGSAFVNESGYTYVAYLFATCAGVSKVGSYTGNGTTQTINCGFAGGARFVLIKRTDSTGDWYVYDTARGMTTLVDPYIQINTGNAEAATLGSVTTVSTGFAVNASILAAINTNTASYIYLAIA